MTTRSSTARTHVAIGGLLALGALFAWLGTWQLERADESRATRAQFAGGAAEAVLPALPRRLEDDDRFRRVELRGEYATRPQFLLDNMLHDGVAGYHVLTALRISGRLEQVLVNRGWVAAGGDRRVLPEVEAPPGLQTLSGRLERLPRPGLRLGDPGAEGDGEDLAVLQYPTADDLSRRLGEPVYDYQVLLDAEAPGGYVREWTAPGVAPERNLAYAGQWFALAVGAVGAGLVIAYRTARRKP